MAEDLNASIKITAFDAFTAPVEGMKRALTTLGTSAMALKGISFAGISNSTTRVGMAMDNLRGSVMGVRSALASVAISGAGFALFKKQLIDPAVGFERFTAQLTAVEGSSVKAQKSMAWIEKFAIDTPFDLDETARAFQSLRVKGIEPTHGVMQGIGEAASGMGKHLEEATDAINQALKGRMLGLGDFGIMGHDAGTKLQFAYVDAAGKKRVREANKSDRQMVANTLAAIFNDKFRGAMGLFDKTYAGMVENLGDSWDEFRRSIMRAGLFEYIKGNMSELLDWVRKVTKSGQLDLWAKNISDAFISAFEFIKTEGPRIAAAVMGVAHAANFAAQMFGGWNNVLEIFLAYKAFGVAKALFGLGAATLEWGASWVKVGGQIMETLHPAFGLQIKNISDLRTALVLLKQNGWAALTPIGLLVGQLSAVFAAGTLGYLLGKYINQKFVSRMWEPNNPQARDVYKTAGNAATSSSAKGPSWDPDATFSKLPSWAVGVAPPAHTVKAKAAARKLAFPGGDNDGRMRGEMTIQITTAAGLAASVSNVVGQNLDINAIYNGISAETP